MSLSHTKALQLLNTRLKRERAVRVQKGRTKWHLGTPSKLDLAYTAPSTWPEPQFGVQGKDGKVQVLRVAGKTYEADQVIASFAHGS